MRYVFLGLIKIYQLTLSRFMGNSCRYYPSCSRYGYEAIRRHGTIKGLALTIWRVLRCNPFTMGGYDPVPEKHSHGAGAHQH